MRGLLGAFLVSVFITIPVAIWFVDLSHRRGRSILQKRHERGAMLVDRDILHAEISQHNLEKFEEEAKDSFPSLSPGQVLRLTRSEEHTSELQSLMRNSYAVLCLKKKNKK